MFGKEERDKVSPNIFPPGGSLLEESLGDTDKFLRRVILVQSGAQLERAVRFRSPPLGLTAHLLGNAGKCKAPILLEGSLLKR